MLGFNIDSSRTNQKTVWPCGLRCQIWALVRKCVGSNPTAVTIFGFLFLVFTLGNSNQDFGPLRVCSFYGWIYIYQLQPISTYFNLFQPTSKKKYQLQPTSKKNTNFNLPQPTSTYFNLLHPFTHPIYPRKEQALCLIIF